ncbi:hypothetical protein D9757_000227 [Collybiopsis confluens]|uniref:C2 domain-containing protein n=1 Tax=Collybiopsis confluens TaxID=2823264 RepID=A0A8H5MGQ6_9AGAR|nr:hypothetical protein D9757_000227 [Collybiopsis confluens]
MLKLWPTTPSAMDQLTPRIDAKGHEQNPFDTPTGSYRQPSINHPLLTPTRIAVHSPFVPASAYSLESPLTPHGPTSPNQTSAHAAFAASLPTTSLSLHAPDFNMQLPPPKSKSSLSANKSSETPPSPAPPPSLNSASSRDSTSTPVSKGQIHVKLIQARGLNVRSISARPYVVVQFEQNEFISRDPTDETDKEVKGTATTLLPKQPSSTAMNALAAVKRRSGGTSAPESKDTSPVSSVGSKGSSGLSGGGLFGRLSAHNPVWKHEVSFDVTNSDSLVTFNVYDRAVDDTGFLGILQVKPVLIHDHSVDQWYK